MIALSIAFVVILGALLALPRLFMGPTLYDRLLALNTALVKVALLIASLGAAFARPDDVLAAIALLMSGVVLNVGVLKFVAARSFQPPLVWEQPR